MRYKLKQELDDGIYLHEWFLFFDEFWRSPKPYHDQLLFNDFNLNRKLEQLSKKVELDLNVDVGMATVDVY